jgi:hypothetical protein
MPRAGRTAVLGQSRPTGAICIGTGHPPPSMGIRIGMLTETIDPPSRSLQPPAAGTGGIEPGIAPSSQRAGGLGPNLDMYVRMCPRGEPT